jgi:hypothetical protein
MPEPVGVIFRRARILEDRHARDDARIIPESLPPDVGRFDGQVALITGAAHGQGRATALAFAREGARIAALDVARPLAYPGYTSGSATDLEQLAADVQAAGSEVRTFAADVRDDNALPWPKRWKGSAASTSCSTTPASAPMGLPTS